MVQKRCISFVLKLSSPIRSSNCSFVNSCYRTQSSNQYYPSRFLHDALSHDPLVVFDEALYASAQTISSVITSRPNDRINQSLLQLVLVKKEDRKCTVSDTFESKLYICHLSTRLTKNETLEIQTHSTQSTLVSKILQLLHCGCFWFRLRRLEAPASCSLTLWNLYSCA